MGKAYCRKGVVCQNFPVRIVAGLCRVLATLTDREAAPAHAMGHARLSDSERFCGGRRMASQQAALETQVTVSGSSETLSRELSRLSRATPNSSVILWAIQDLNLKPTD